METLSKLQSFLERVPAQGANNERFNLTLSDGKVSPGNCNHK